MEIRLQIIRYVFEPDHSRICPHDDRQLVVPTRHIVANKGRVGTPFNKTQRDPVSWNHSLVECHDPLPNLRPDIVDSSLGPLFTNRQIKTEMSGAFVLYLEHCFPYLKLQGSTL